ncbi:MAG: hypothetical protein KatS3mg009_0766 [Acidimicrobiia bacterium]|nr:MAG: hypothetical protein KatS3mg009_0766 [Acidimicrobiia bacterium]
MPSTTTSGTMLSASSRQMLGRSFATCSSNPASMMRVVSSSVYSFG